MRRTLADLYLDQHLGFACTKSATPTANAAVIESFNNTIYWLQVEPTIATSAAVCAVGAVLLVRWVLLGIACRLTSRLHFESVVSLANWRVSLSLLVAMSLLAISFVPDIRNLQMPCIGLACSLLGAAGILGGTEFREYGLMAGGVLIPWSRIKRVSWVDHKNYSTMWVEASWCTPLAVKVNNNNKQAVDRLVRSAARYERLPVTYWLANILTRTVFASLIGGAVIAIMV